MKTKIVVIISTLIFAFTCTIKYAYSQTEEIVIAMDKVNTCQEYSGSFDILLLLKMADNFHEILRVTCKTDQNDLKYMMYYENSKGKFYVFKEYSKPAGLMKIHYFDVENLSLNSSVFFKETQIPLTTTANFKKLKLQYVSLEYDECGKILSSKLNRTWSIKTSNNTKSYNYEILDKLLINIDKDY